ncbi:peroxidasin homolog [Ornithodoros turicata]|uniref:peroxidasin homolog n=1 Tax=Ornithodoros turicata TaxID=34597 RepID=UPI003138C401
MRLRHVHLWRKSSQGEKVDEMISCRRLLRFIIFVFLASTFVTSVPWNIEIPSPPPSVVTSDSCSRMTSTSLPARVANFSHILQLAAEYGVREAEKYSDTFGFSHSKYENLTWPRFRRRPDAKIVEEVAFASQFATEFVADRLRLDHDVIFRELPCIDTLTTAGFGKLCPEKLREFHLCPRRALDQATSDARCNNFNQPFWGSSFTPLLRLLQPRYADGISKIRSSTTGVPLPSARLLSQTLSLDTNNPDPKATLMLMQWGQFLDHDLSMASMTISRTGFPPGCCHHLASYDSSHPACLPIKVSWKDPFYRKFMMTCMDFARSAPAAKEACALGPRDHINQVTAFIDASTVYGSSPEEAQLLRLFSKGRLREMELPGFKPLLPPGTDAEIMECQMRGRNSKCFLAGDTRANEQPGLTALHTVWMREHNRVAQALFSLNPDWDDEKIFKETRRIIVAEIQHICLNEFLTAILGETVVQIFGLKHQRSGYFYGYDPEVNPSISNVFSAAAFRFGHSLVPHAFHRYDKHHRLLRNDTPLHSEFFNPTELFKPGALDRLLFGLLNQPAQSMDEYLTPEVTNRLFQPQGRRFGLDLMAVNVQRGRDHGIAPYVYWRSYCGLQAVKSFEDLFLFMDGGAVEAFKKLYASLEDIDLFPAALAEKPVLDGIVGPTFGCLIAEQFVRLRKGDRFWYENGRFESSFKKDQMAELRKATMARILCDNMDDIDTVQINVMEQANQRKNPRRKCSSIPKLDLLRWKE